LSNVSGAQLEVEERFVLGIKRAARGSIADLRLAGGSAAPDSRYDE
jgi:hypothetical protein